MSKWFAKNKSSKTKVSENASKEKEDVKLLKEKLQKEKESLESEIKEIKEQKEKLQKEKQSISNDVKEIEEIRKEKKDLKSQVDVLRKDKQILLNQKENVRKELWGLQSEKIEIEKFRDNFNKENSAFLETKKSFMKEKEDFDKEREEFNKEKDNYIDKISGLTEEVEKLRGEIEEMPSYEILDEEQGSDDLKEKLMWEKVEPTGTVQITGKNIVSAKEITAKELKESISPRNTNAERSGEKIPFTHRELLAFKKAQLKIICKEYGINFTEKDTKKVLTDRILDYKKSL